MKVAKLSKFSGEKKAGNKGKDAKKVIKVENMNEFFGTQFGKSIKPSLTKTTKQYQGQSIYKVGGNTGKHLKKGDQFYLDAQHKAHLEVFNKRGNIKNVLNLDGTKNIEKTKKALAERRNIK